MGEKSKKVALMMMLCFLVFFDAIFSGCFSAASQPPSKKRLTERMARYPGSSVFPVTGNVYPLGYYFVSIKIGRPPKLYDLDIDTGSDLTWVQCDAPCTGCTKPRDSLYKPSNNVVQCEDPQCAALDALGDHSCKRADEQCDYEVGYADHGSSLGVLVNDYFPMRFTNGSALSPRLAFGCGYNQHFPSLTSPPPTSGVLGLGNGKASILTQLHGIGLTRNVIGHCLSGRGGFLFFGDDLVPSSGIVWVPMSHNSFAKHYSSGPVEIYFGGKTTGIKGLYMVFDSGSSYTYLNSKAYQTTLNLVKNDLNGKPLKAAAEEKALPVCWKGTKPFKSIHDVKNYFKPLVMKFTNSNAQLQLPPEAYLIVTKNGNVCFGILNGSEAGVGNLNIIGDISLQDKMVIYDNEKHQIGWGPANCDRLPNIDGDYNEDFSQPYAASFGILEDYTASFAFQEDQQS